MTGTCQKSRWDDDIWGPMTESSIRRRQAELGRARISRYTYERGDEIIGTSKACVAYVLKGRCLLTSGEATTSLEAGDVLSFSGGDLKIRVDEEDPAVVVWVWAFSDLFRQDLT